jgi:cytoskeletal protein CcmA (bactofilin family)
MSNIFNHTAQPINSTTSPTEALALEVSEAFDSVSTIISKEGSVITDYKDIIGNIFLDQLQKHGAYSTTTQNFPVIANSKDFELNAVPDGVVLTVTYTESGNDTVLTRINASADFSDTMQYKLYGKVISTNLSEQTGVITIDYSGYAFNLNGVKVLSNCLKNTDNSFHRSPEETGTGTYRVIFDTDIENNLGDHLVNTNNPLFFFTTENYTYYNIIPVTNFTIDGATVNFTSADYSPTINSKVVVVVNNTTIFELVNHLYAEFVNHDHSNDKLSKGLTTTDLLDRHKDTAVIGYGDGLVPNYQFPQYLNREGYNSDLDSVYENAFLGTLFLGSIISETDQLYKSLGKNSYELVFGDPDIGPKIFYNYLNNGLTIEATAGYNGLTIETDELNPQLKLNSSEFTSKSGESLSVKPAAGLFKIEDVDVSTKSKLAVSLIDVLEAIQINSGVVEDRLDFGNIRLEVLNGNLTIGLIDNLIDSVLTLANKTHIVSGTFDNLKFTDNSELGLDSENYLGIVDDRLAIVNNRAVLFVGSSGDSGYELRKSSTAMPSFKLYNSSKVKEASTLADENTYIEIPKDQKLYLIANTTESHTVGGVTYEFNNDAASNNVNDLQDWFKASVVLGDLELDASTEDSKKGLKIGSTTISVIGDNLDCPAGLTLIESDSAVNIVQPMSGPSCTNLKYQDLATGSLTVNGLLLAQESLHVASDLTVGGSVSLVDVEVADTLKTASLVVEGGAEILTSLVVNGTVNIKNKALFENDLTVNANLKASAIETTGSVSIGAKLFVEDALYIRGDSIIDGTLQINAGITTAGELRGASIVSDTLDVQTGRVSRTLEVLGGATIGGALTAKSNAVVGGSLTVAGDIATTKDLTCEDLFTIGSISARGGLSVNGIASLVGNNITIGTDTSYTTLSGKVQFNTANLSFNGETKFLNTVNILGDTKTLGLFENSGGIVTQSSITATGNISTEGSLYVNTGVTTTTATINDSLVVNGNTTMQAMTLQTGTVETLVATNLKVFNSLAMDQGTTLTAGDFRCLSVNQQDQTQVSYFAGNLDLAKNLGVAQKVVVGVSVDIGDGLSLKAGSITGDSLAITAETMTVDNITGSKNINTPSSLFVSGINSAINLGSQISNKKFTEFDNTVTNGVAIFNEPVIVDELLFSKLTYIGALSDGSLDIVAKRARYA